MRSYKKLKLTFRGQTKTLAAWAEEYNMDYQIVRRRILYYGWTAEKALTMPVLIKHRLMRVKEPKVGIMNELITSIVSNSIKATIWNFKKKKYRALKDNFQKNIPGYLHTHWLKVA